MPFSLSITLPFDAIDLPDEFCTMQAVRECAQAAENAGFFSGTVTDRPIPATRALREGESHAQDPFVMLAMVAAVTTRLRLQTDIVVLPYRNPFVTARAVASLDHFSDGRVIFGIGAGHLKSEYKALGADFDTRNDRMDEYIDAMKLAWSGEDFAFEGTGYAAVGNRMLPTPAQRPHPPLLIGGNSKRALRRAAERGDAWHPFLVPEDITQTARTANLDTDQRLASAIRYLHDYCDQIGRQVRPSIIASASFKVARGYSAQKALDRYARLAEFGLVGSGATVVAGCRSEWIDLTQSFGNLVLSRMA